MTSWLVQVFEMTDAHTQEISSALLAGLDAVRVEALVDAGHCRRLVVVESTDLGDATSVFNLITSVDPTAELLHTSRGRPVDGQAPDPDPATA